jgi:hypothetical protein
MPALVSSRNGTFGEAMAGPHNQDRIANFLHRDAPTTQPFTDRVPTYG